MSWCVAGLGAACGPLGDQSGEEPLGRASEAIDVCNEAVPSNRYVDGFPAYSQCDATTGSIWSNNGIDTATSSQGSDWVRTQQGGGYQCTEWAWRYMHFRWGVDYRHGDAKQWCDGTLPSTLVKSTTPLHGDLIVFDGGVCGADATTGHIAVIDTVDTAASKVTIVEENRAGRRATDQSCALCFLHATANDGSTAAGGAGGMHGGSAGAGAGAGATSGGAMGRGGAPSFGGSTASGGRDARGGGGGAFSTAGRGSGGAAQMGSGGSTTNDGGRGATNSGGAESSGAPNAAGRGEIAGSDVGGTSTNGGTSASVGVGGAPSASAGTASAGRGAEVPAGDADLPADATSGGCQLGRGGQRGAAGWLLLLACWALVRKRRFVSLRRVA